MLETIAVIAPTATRMLMAFIVSHSLRKVYRGSEFAKLRGGLNKAPTAKIYYYYFHNAFIPSTVLMEEYLCYDLWKLQHSTRVHDGPPRR